MRHRRFRVFQRGFTLMELVVTLAIIAIAAAVILPEMRGTREDALLRASGRRLISAANLAYSQSVVRQETHRISLHPETGRFAIERQARTPWGGRPTSFAAAADLPSGGRGEVDARVRVEFRPLDLAEDAGMEPGSGTPSPSVGSPALIFHPDGTADAAEVLLRDAAGFRLTLRLNPVSARLQPFDLDRP